MTTSRAWPLFQRPFLLVAALLAVALMSLYVQLLHDSLARGQELREALRISGMRNPAKAMAPNPRARTAQARVVAARETAGNERTGVPTRVPPSAPTQRQEPP
jgi:hypothetical protein